MGQTLHLGVIDLPYQARITQAEQSRRLPRGGVRWRRPRRPSVNRTTTGDVAEILEARYGLFSMFALLAGKDITDALEEAMRGRLESLIMRGVNNPGPIFDAGDLGEIEARFRQFLDNREMDGRASGVPTEAARRGVNPRLAHPYARSNPERPSFISSGLLQNSFKVWIT